MWKRYPVSLQYSNWSQYFFQRSFQKSLKSMSCLQKIPFPGIYHKSWPPVTIYSSSFLMEIGFTSKKSSQMNNCATQSVACASQAPRAELQSLSYQLQLCCQAAFNDLPPQDNKTSHYVFVLSPHVAMFTCRKVSIVHSGPYSNYILAPACSPCPGKKCSYFAVS